MYSYGIDVSKTDKSSGASLSGAEFTLSANKDGSSPIKFILVSEGVYRAALSGEADSVETLSVGASADLTGKLTLTGLDAGTYLSLIHIFSHHCRLQRPMCQAG